MRQQHASELESHKQLTDDKFAVRKRLMVDKMSALWNVMKSQAENLAAAKHEISSQGKKLDAAESEISSLVENLAAAKKAISQQGKSIAKRKSEILRVSNTVTSQILPSLADSKS